jgi:hypothetical protein
LIRRHALRASLVVLVLLTGCQQDRPEPGDVRPEAYLLYPGAVEVSRDWLGESKYRTVDGSELSNVARMSIRFRLPGPVPNSDIWQWYEGQLRDKGWTRQEQAALNHTDFAQQVGKRRHLLVVMGGTDIGAPISTFSVHYNIDRARG